MTEYKHAEGEIEAVSPKDNQYGVKINDEWYNKYGKCPSWVVKGVNAYVTYSENEKGGKVFRNIENITQRKSMEVPTEKQEKTESPESEFRQANGIDRIDQIVGAAAIIQDRCHAATERVLRREPKTDGEIAMVNSMFIEVNKRISSATYVEFCKRASNKIQE